MNVGDTLFACSEAGLRLEVAPGGALRVRPAERLEGRPELATALQEHKAGIIRILRSEELTRLLKRGWRPKVRLGKTIWANPRTGFWCSEESAVIFMRRAAGEETKNE